MTGRCDGTDHGAGQPAGCPGSPVLEGQLIRHLDDLRTGSYEGATTRAEREAIFRSAVELLSGTVLAALEAANLSLLDSGGTGCSPGLPMTATAGSPPAGNSAGQRSRRHREGCSPDRLAPAQVRAIFPRGWTHGHLRGGRLGNWPLQVTSAADVPGFGPVIGAIIAAELHEVIYESAVPGR